MRRHEKSIATSGVLVGIVLGVLGLFPAFGSWLLPRDAGTVTPVASSTSPATVQSASRPADVAAHATTASRTSVGEPSGDPATRLQINMDQPGGIDLDTMRVVIDPRATVGDLFLTTEVAMGAYFEARNGARLIIPTGGLGYRGGCAKPVAAPRQMALAGAGMEAEIPDGTWFCVQTNDKRMAAVLLVSSVRARGMASSGSRADVEVRSWRIDG